MKFHVLTLFPEMVMQGLGTSIIGRAVENNLIEIDAVNIRDHSEDRHGKVDDYPYGGGAGMLMQAQPVYDAWRAVAKGAVRPRTIYVTPQGQPFTQQLAEKLAEEEELILLCGHYEGIDERVLEEIVTDYVSIGDYVLTGGELPAMVMIDAIARLVPGVLHNDVSAVSESFCNDLLEYPQYSRPEVWHDKAVPKVLLSGDHRRVEEWRLEQARERTARIRPDLYERYQEKQRLIGSLARRKRDHIHLTESLARGNAQILFWEGEKVLLYDAHSRLCMITVPFAAALDGMAGLVPEQAEEIQITFGESPDSAALEEIKKMFAGRKSMRRGECAEYSRFLYTQRVPLAVRHKDIRILGSRQAEDVLRHFPDGDPTCGEIRAQILAGRLYGAFQEGELIGFAGLRRAGAIGFLYVEEPYRRRGIASSLEAYCINRLLEEGRTPYGQIPAENEAALALQEKLGLYRADNNFILFS